MRSLAILCCSVWFSLLAAGEDSAAIPSCETDFFAAPLDRLHHLTSKEKTAEEAIADLPAWGTMDPRTHERLVNLWNWHNPDICAEGFNQWVQELEKSRLPDTHEMAAVLMALQRWCGSWSWDDSLTGFRQFYRLCVPDAPIDTQEQLDYLALMASYTPMNATALQAMHEVFSGKRPTVAARRDQVLLNSMRLWSDPARYAQDIIRTGRQADCQAMRMYLRDFSSLKVFFRQSGLRVAGYPRGLDMPAQGAAALDLLARRHAAALPGKGDVAALLQRRPDLPAICLGMPVRAALAIDPQAAPWKPAVEHGHISPLEMPDCSVVALPQWNASFLGFAGEKETPDQYVQWAKRDLAALREHVESLKQNNRIAPCMREVIAHCLQEMNESRARWWMEKTGNRNTPAQSSGPAARSCKAADACLSEDAHRLFVRLHRVCLELAWLGEHVRLADAFDAEARELAALCNECGLWPLIVLECEAFKLDPLVKRSLFLGYRGDVQYLTSMVNNTWARRYAAMFHKPIRSDKLIEGMMDVHVLADELPSGRMRKRLVAERWLDTATRVKHVLPICWLCVMGMEDIVNRRQSVTVKEVTTHASYTGFALVLQSIGEGRLERARSIYGKMDSMRYAMPLSVTCLARAALDRAEGREAAARRCERDALMIGVARILDRYGSAYQMQRAFLHSGLLDELEKISCFQSRSMPLELMDDLAGAWAGRGQYTSACFDWELLVHNAVFKMAVLKSQSHANIVCWRLKADACRGLALLQQGKREEGLRLVHAALEGMRENPVAAAEAVKWVLQCPFLSREERLRIKAAQIEALETRMAEPFPRRKNYNELALDAIRQASVDPAPALDRPEDPRDFERMQREAQPFSSEWAEWHILPHGDDAGETLEARIAGVEYERGDDQAGVLLLTRAGRYARVAFSQLEPQVIRHVIDWKRNNNMRTWMPAAGNPAELSTPQDGRLEEVRREGGRIWLKIVGSTGFLYEVPFEHVSEQDQRYIQEWEDEHKPRHTSHAF